MPSPQVGEYFLADDPRSFTVFEVKGGITLLDREGEGERERGREVGGVDVIFLVGGLRRMCITCGRSTEFDSCWGKG